MQVEVMFKGGPHAGRMAKLEVPELSLTRIYNVEGADYRFVEGPVFKAVMKVGEPIPNTALLMEAVESEV